MSILSISVADRTKTKNGNEYNSTNVGKITGAAIGTSATAVVGYKMHNAKKVLLSDEILGLTKEGYNTVFEELPEDMKSIVKGAIEEAPKYLKKAMKITTIAIGSAVLLSALGLGTLSDAIINKIRAIKADKSNPMLKTDKTETNVK